MSDIYMSNIYKKAESRETAHKVKRINNLMYDGCEPHWQCIYCGTCIPFHCYKKEDIELMECPARLGVVDNEI